jgi:alpha-L-fucosidase
MKRYNFFLWILFSLFLLTCSSQKAPKTKEQAVQNWRDAKFSMFIHWGLYSQLGGEWNGERVTKGYSEQIRAHGQIPKEDYAALAADFNPVNWDPDAVCQLAKAAGMKSIVFTAKHHDGFNMFHTEYSDFNIVDATPYGRDVVKELAEACQRHDLKFGIYYSLIDWHFPDARPISGHNSDPITKKHEEFNALQITELVTKYGPISEFWFDMSAPTVEQSKRFTDIVHEHQPFCLVSSRVWNDQGDFNVMGDNFFPNFKMQVPWQTPASMFNETWGYRVWQERGDVNEKISEKIRAMVRVVSRGGNYLLNIGPMGDGSIVPFEAAVLRGIGSWMQANGEAIYGTRPTRFDKLDFGEATLKPGIIYLFVFDWPEDGLFKLPGMQNNIINARFLTDETQSLKAAAYENGQILQAPTAAQHDSSVTVFVVQYEGDLTIEPSNVITSAEDKIHLTTENATNYYSFTQPEYYSSLRSTVKQEWNIRLEQPGDYAPVFRYTEQEVDKNIRLTIGDRDTVITLDATNAQSMGGRATDISLGKLYKHTGFGRCSLGLTHGKTSNINPILTWSLDTIYRWQSVPRWSSSSILRGADGDFTPTYFYQQIFARKAQNFIIAIGSDDALQVWLNGEQLVLKNQKQPNELNRDVIRLPLRKGANELLIKNYNRFGAAPMGFIDYRVPQQHYVKKVPPITLEANELKNITLQLDAPESPHEDLGLINFDFWLEKK